MSLSRGTAFLAALALMAGAAAAQQPENPRRPNAPNQANPNQNERPEQTPSRTPRTPRPPGTTPATPAQPGAPGEGATPATPAQPGNVNANVALGFLRASQTVGVAVQSEDGQEIGVIADLLLSTPMGTGQVSGSGTFALISVEGVATGRVAVIPWELLRYENGVFILAFDMTRLNDVPSVMLDDPRLLENQEWLGQVNEFFAEDLQRIQRARPDLDNANPERAPNPRNPTTPTPATPGTGTNPRTPNPRTPNPTTPDAGTNTPEGDDIIGRDRALPPPQPGTNNPGTGTTPAPRTSQPGAGTNPNP